MGGHLIAEDGVRNLRRMDEIHLEEVFRDDLALGHEDMDDPLDVNHQGT